MHTQEMDKSFHERHPVLQLLAEGAEAPKTSTGEEQGEEEEDKLLPSIDRPEMQYVCGREFESAAHVEAHYGLEHRNKSYKCAGAWIYKQPNCDSEELALKQKGRALCGVTIE